MMNFCKLIGLGGLICMSTLRAEANSAIEPSIAIKPAIQAVIQPDGSVVDRLKLPHSAKLTAAQNRYGHDVLPDSPEAWLARMLDPTRHGLVLKHPELFAEWLDAVTEPRFMTALASVALTPETYTNTLGKIVDPAAARNWAEFADPQIYMRWMATGLDPNFYQAVFNRMTEAGKLKRWGLYSTGLNNAAYVKSVNSTKAVSTLSSKRLLANSGTQDWMQLPAHESKANPWLPDNLNYRY